MPARLRPSQPPPNARSSLAPAYSMCGHATLASSHALFELHPTADTITFETMSGTLTAQRGSTAGSIQLSFPHDLSVLSSPFLDLHAAREASVELEDRVKLEMGVKDACAAFAGRVVGAAKGRLGWIVEVDSETDLKGAKIDVRDWVSAMIESGRCSRRANKRGFATGVSQPFEGYVVFTQAASALSGDHIHSRVLDPPEVQQEDPVVRISQPLHSFAPLTLSTLADGLRTHDARTILARFPHHPFPSSPPNALDRQDPLRTTSERARRKARSRMETRGRKGTVAR